MPNSVPCVILAFLLPGRCLAQRQPQAPADAAERVRVLNTVDALFSIPEFIHRLAIEVDDGMATEAELERRLGERIGLVFAEPELSRRIARLREVSVHHRSEAFTDLGGVRVAPGSHSFDRPSRAVFRVQRNTPEAISS
jgi:hypothetical protein